MNNSFRMDARLRNLRMVGLPPAESLVWLLFIAIATVTACFHEPWADEAQAWLIARDLSIPGILHQMGYEGSPPLWHLLLWLLTRLRLPYAALGLVSITLVAAAMYIWLRWSPLPRFVRLLLPFAFYYQYQYAVVARSYALSTLLAFAAVALWRAKPPRILAFGFVLALLVQTNLYGCMIAAGIACAFAGEFLSSFLKQRPSQTQLLRAGAAGSLVLASAAIAKFLAQPYADCSFRAARQFEKGTAFGSVARGLSGLPEFSAALGLNLTFFGIGGSVVLLILVLGWFVAVRRPACALPFIFTVLAMGWVWSKPWHYGMALTAFLVSVWAAWPPAHPPALEWPARLMAFSLAALLVCQFPSTAETIGADIHGAYSGGKATAEYLRPYVGKRPIYCINFYGTSIQPYFDRNIFANWPTAFWTWSNHWDYESKRILKESPPGNAIIVVPIGGQTALKFAKSDSARVELARSRFQKKHEFCGAQFWLGRVSEYECYEIYERSR